MDIEKINNLLKPLNTTFEELFTERYNEIKNIEFEIEKLELTIKFKNCNEIEINEKIIELMKKKHKLICGNKNYLNEKFLGEKIENESIK